VIGFATRKAAGWVHAQHDGSAVPQSLLARADEMIE
jgi:hypothetical protein